jgi:hypothetical protein
MSTGHWRCFSPRCPGSTPLSKKSWCKFQSENCIRSSTAEQFYWHTHIRLWYWVLLGRTSDGPRPSFPELLIAHFDLFYYFISILFYYSH